MPLSPEPLTILIVEDDPASTQSVVDGLKLYPEVRTTVLEARSLAECEKLILERKIDCIVLDLSLPDAGGLSALQRIKAKSPTVPVVIYTGTDDIQMGVDAVRAGADNYLVKGSTTHDSIVREILHSIVREERRWKMEEHQRKLESMIASLKNGIQP